MLFAQRLLVIQFCLPVEHFSGKGHGILFFAGTQNAFDQTAARGAGVRRLNPALQVGYGRMQFEIFDQGIAVFFQRVDKGLFVIFYFNPGISRIPPAFSGMGNPGHDLFQKQVSGIGLHITGGQVDGGTEKHLAPFAFHPRGVGNHGMGHLTVENVFVGQCRDQGLHVGSVSHVCQNVFKNAVIPVFEPAVPHAGKFPETDQLVQGHAGIENAHLGQVAAQPGRVPEAAVQTRALVGAHQGNQIVHQPEIRNKIPFKKECSADEPVQPDRTERGDRTAKHPVGRLFFPAPPEHAQMGVIQFMGKKSQDLFRVKVFKVEAIGRSAVSAWKQAQKMLRDLDDQVPQVFFMPLGEPGSRIGQQLRQFSGTDTDMGPVIGQADVGAVGKDHQVGLNDAGFLEFGDPVDLASGQHLVAKLHIGMFFFAPVPARQAGTHEQVAVKRIRQAFIEPVLHDRRGCGKKHPHLLSGILQPQFFFRIQNQHLGEQKSDQRFRGKGPADTPGPDPGPHRMKGKNFRGGVVIEKMGQHFFAGLFDSRMDQGCRPDQIGQGELEQIGNRDADHGFSRLIEPELTGIGPEACRRRCFVSQ